MGVPEPVVLFFAVLGVIRFVDIVQSFARFLLWRRKRRLG